MMAKVYKSVCNLVLVLSSQFCEQWGPLSLLISFVRHVLMSDAGGGCMPALPDTALSLVTRLWRSQVDSPLDLTKAGGSEYTAGDPLPRRQVSFYVRWWNILTFFSVAKLPLY